MNEKATSNASEPQSPNRDLFIGLGIVAGLIVVEIIAIIVVFALLDPFNIMTRLTGRYDPIANALPPETALFLCMDIAKLKTDETNRIIDAFAEAAEAAGIEDTTSLLDELDDRLQESLDLTVTEDILPWIGQYVGLSISSLDIDYASETFGDIILLIEVRNRRKADDFVEKIVAKLGEETDQVINELEYRGMTSYEIQTKYDYENFAFGRLENVFIITTNLELLKDCVDAAKGESFVDTPEYDEIASALPEDRAISFLMNTNIFETFQDTYDEILPGFEGFQSQQFQSFRWMAGSFSTVEEGIQMDFIVSYDEELLSSDQLSMLESTSSESDLAQLFPEETFFYFTGTRLDLMWENIRETMIMSAGTAEFEESMDLFSDEFGFNPDTDFFPLLDGAWSFGLLHTQKGYLAEIIEIPLGLFIMIESSDNERMQYTLENFAHGIEDAGIGLVWQRQSDDLTLYDLEDPYDEAVILTFGAGKGFLMIGTDQATLDETFTRQNSLADNERFGQALPEEMRPVLFMDLGLLFDILEDEFRMTDDADALTGLEVLRPLSSIAAASAPYEDGLVQSTIIVFIESD